MLSFFLHSLLSFFRKSFSFFIIASPYAGSCSRNIIGDSLSVYSRGFGLSQKLGSKYSVKDFSVVGRTQTDWLNDISRPFEPNPEILLIELGTNDAMNIPVSLFSENLNKLIDEIRKRSSARIILTAIPLTDDPVLQTRIRQTNSLVRNLTSRYAIADTEAEFAKNISTVRLYPFNDPIHPEPVGYEIMGNTYAKVIAGL